MERGKDAFPLGEIVPPEEFEALYNEAQPRPVQ
jgi:hypothetical protein